MLISIERKVMPNGGNPSIVLFSMFEEKCCHRAYVNFHFKMILLFCTHFPLRDSIDMWYEMNNFLLHWWNIHTRTCQPCPRLACGGFSVAFLLQLNVYVTRDKKGNDFFLSLLFRAFLKRDFSTTIIMVKNIPWILYARQPKWVREKSMRWKFNLWTWTLLLGRNIHVSFGIVSVVFAFFENWSYSVGNKNSLMIWKGLI